MFSAEQWQVVQRHVIRTQAKYGQGEPCHLPSELLQVTNISIERQVSSSQKSQAY
jgi:hypothetical protein